MAEVLQTISVVIAALTVALGVTAWRRTELGKRRIELAEETLALFYEARDAIRMIRSPFGFAGEGKSRKREEGEPDEVAEIRDRAYVVFERYNTKSEVFSRLASLRYRFQAYFGEHACRPFSELDAIMHKIFGSARILSDLWTIEQASPRSGHNEQNLKYMREAKAIFWEGTQNPDPLNPRIDAMLTNVNDTCQKVINLRPTFCSLWEEWLANARRFWLCRD